MAAQKTIQDKQVLSLALPGELLQQIEDYRFKHRFHTRLEAIRYLIEYALSKDPAPGQERVVHHKQAPYDVYIGRASRGMKKSKWHNPFKIDEDGTREEVLEKYRRYLLYNEQFGKTLPDGRELLKDLHELEGKVLGCWCKPEACHGDILIELMGGG